MATDAIVPDMYPCKSTLDVCRATRCLLRDIGHINGNHRSFGSQTNALESRLDVKSKREKKKSTIVNAVSPRGNHTAEHVAINRNSCDTDAPAHWCYFLLFIVVSRDATVYIYLSLHVVTPSYYF